MLPREAIHTLHDGVMVETEAQEQWALNVINEKKVNNTQIFSKKTSSINLFKSIIEKNEFTTKVVVEACRCWLADPPSNGFGA